MAVKIVTDSSADLPSDLARELEITVVPANVHFGEETFRDGLDLDADGFFQRLVAAPQLPSTSQASPGVFLEAYRGLVEAGHQVVSIHISSKLSGMMNSARQAKEQLSDAPVELVDSFQASLGLGLVVTAAARAVKGGAHYNEAVEVAHRALGQVQVIALLDTLEYLIKGGRVGKVRGFIGSVLRVRPIITVKEGIAQSVTSVRSRAAGLQYIQTIAEERAPLLQAGVIHATTPEEAETLAERLRPLLREGALVRTRFGSALGTHVGPGAIGIAFQSEKSPP